MMKKFSPIIIAILCISFFSMHINALDDHTNIITINNIDVIFDNNSTLAFEEKQLIAEHIVYGVSDNIQTYGLICNLFGHKNTTQIVYTTTHRVNPTSPRCLRETWEVITCSRCDNVEIVVINHCYISCCPVD